MVRVMRVVVVRMRVMRVVVTMRLRVVVATVMVVVRFTNGFERG